MTPTHRVNPRRLLPLALCLLALCLPPSPGRAQTPAPAPPPAMAEVTLIPTGGADTGHVNYLGTMVVTNTQPPTVPAQTISVPATLTTGAGPLAITVTIWVRPLNTHLSGTVALPLPAGLSLTNLTDGLTLTTDTTQTPPVTTATAAFNALDGGQSATYSFDAAGPSLSPAALAPVVTPAQPPAPTATPSAAP